MPTQTQLQEKPAALVFADRARELTEFCVRRGGQCFADWPVPTVFAYAFFHAVARTVFIVREHASITAVAFAWGMPAATIRDRAAKGEPIFQWRRSKDSADSLFLAETIGTQAQLGNLTRQVFRRWPDFAKKTVLTFRHDRLVELRGATIERLTHGQR
jgi:hypothetical protein